MKLTRTQLTTYPDPRFRRERFTVLDGIWDFSFQDSESEPTSFERTIRVPFTYETPLSGIGDPTPREVVWYRTSFAWHPQGRTLLKFGAVDYQCDVFLNGHFVGNHTGGFTSFEWDVTETIKEQNILVLRVRDSLNPSQIRGKQRTKAESYECWYVQTTGIWKSVYLESAGSSYVKTAQFAGHMDGVVDGHVVLSIPADATVSVFDPQRHKVWETQSRDQKEILVHFILPDPQLWCFETPNLYHVEITVNGPVVDRVGTYFGLRTVKSDQGKLSINGRPLFLSMILNQGYYPQSGLSAPDKEAIIQDFRLIKAMGFNGCRIHQKIENPLFYFLADWLGLYLWSELPSAYRFDETMQEEILRELPKMIRQNINSPSIIVYVLFNESWGVPAINDHQKTQRFVEDLKKSVLNLDTNRLVITNDGWFQTESTDIVSLHEYEQDPTVFLRDYGDKEKVISEKTINRFGPAMAQNQHYHGQPIVISEFGGASIQSQTGWGYGQKANGLGEYKTRLSRIFEACQKIPYLAGYCYTQFADVEQETNGLVYANRLPKLPLAEIRAIVKGKKHKK